jgi:hypothetical protein
MGGKAKWVERSSSKLSPTKNTKRKEVELKTPAFVAEIIELSWDSGIDSARDKTKITAPHWKVGENLNEDNNPTKQWYSTGSKKPGVYLIGTKGKSSAKDTFTIKIKVSKNEEIKAATAKVTGKLGKLEFTGDCPTGVGEHTVTMKFKALPDKLEHVEGDAKWTISLDSPALKADLKHVTRLELFFILDKPMSFYTQGVWAEALRLVFKKAKVGGTNTADAASKKVTTYCHTEHGMKYDTVRGGSNFKAYNIGGNKFELFLYITKRGIDGKNTVNCYDQAAAVQAFSGALGIQMQWIFLNPYGYINLTNLIGVGSCNNPFFQSNGSKPVVPDNDPRRTAFGNHAFIIYSQKIHDACAGPHAGTETLREYMLAAIDAKASIPAILPGSSESSFYSYIGGSGIPLTGLTKVV